MGSEAAKALGKLRWKDKSEAERKAHALLMLRARWGKRRKKSKGGGK